MSQYPKYDKYSKSEKQKKPGLYERLVTFFQNSRRIIKIASKPKRKDYMLVFKICLVGMVILGVLSWIIQLIFNIVLPPLG
ncbi:MAG: protein translocase SEC61 complex subunit gamma [Promethearchaeota archaeon]|nr:MAG: protein translocase SEC61 complex subunit gamma [Candidatus Lokiarchaeota archaeon]